MRVGIMDADLIGRRRHRFPNLVCMKLSGWHKARGDEVSLLLDGSKVDQYDKVYVAKVFTDTPIDKEILLKPNVTYGGTGFYYDRAPRLPSEIEHHMPDYHLYDDWALKRLPKEIKFYTEFSIGFLTRGCFRHCPFCVNRNASMVVEHSPLEEFYDPSRKYIALLDDNFFGCTNWRELLKCLQATGKAFTFRQGLDARLLDDEKAAMLFKSKYYKEPTFSFDDWRDRAEMETKMKLIRRHTQKDVRFYVLTGYDRRGRYDEEFYRRDLEELMLRLEMLRRYKMLGYVMRHEGVKKSGWRERVYGLIAGWANQPRLWRHMSLSEVAATERWAKYREGYERWKEM